MRRILITLLAAFAIGIVPAVAHGAPVYWGAWVNGPAYNSSFGDAPWDLRSQDAFEANTGKRASIHHYGQPWRWNGVMQNFAVSPANNSRSRGGIPLLDWHPWDLSSSGSTNHPDFRLSRIASGAFDSYMRTWATQVRDWGQPIMVRPMHEMNGVWFPWSEQVNGNTAGSFVPAWRRIVEQARSVGATNIQWVWCPNTVYPGSIPLSGLYPGDSYVDWTCVDGYNFGGTGWIRFDDLFRPTFNQLDAIAPSKPIMIGETSSSESGGSKAEWIAEALEDIASGLWYPRLRAFVWFNWNAESGSTWRIESSASATASFRSGIAHPNFLSTYDGSAPPPPAP